MRIPAILLATLCLLVLTGCDTNSPEDSPYIRGCVVDADGDPVEGAAILLNYDIETPFSGDKPATTINWTIPEAGHVHLWVTEPCGGTTIRTLVNGLVDAGAQSTVWDAMDDDGLLVVEGLYVAHLEYDGETFERDIFFIMNDYLMYDSAENMRSFAVTDELGSFEFPQECLDFGYELVLTDEHDVPLEPQIIPPRVTLYAIREGYSAGAGPTNMTVDPETGAFATIVLGEPRVD